MRGDKGSSRFFVGLPIPLAAGTVVALVIAHYAEFQQNVGPTAQAPVAVVVALLSFLMVSPIRYRTFKDAHLSVQAASPSSACWLLAGLAIAIKTRPSFVLVVYMLAYIAIGLAETIFVRPHPPAPAELPPAVRAELEADEALELDDDGRRQGRQGRGRRVHLGRVAPSPPAGPTAGPCWPPGAPAASPRSPPAPSAPSAPSRSPGRCRASSRSPPRPSWSPSWRSPSTPPPGPAATGRVVDAPGIVIDEVLGYLVAVAFLPFTWQAALVGFVLFRLFDILKPWPASALDRLEDRARRGARRRGGRPLRLGLPAAPAPLPPGGPRVSLAVELLATGDELLTGQVVDTNSPWLMDRLWDAGVMVRRKTLVGDDRAVLEAALRETTGRADLVVMSGGLGPTEDDLTAECVARVLGVPLEPHAAVAGAPSPSASSAWGAP